ncbi:unnamed protein product [Arabidopsis thaliana]|nr:hypothetical protein AXX17_AT1G63140 [Arabidopsis thaliana]CAA0325130.1 unnamed protein product [Arabidopsis thaliana]
MGENRQIRSRSWNRMPTKRCSANGIMEEFILVDDDDVIILDFPESSKRKAPGTSRTRKESIMPRVISIDDDDDETENVQKAGSSSSGNLQTSAEVDNDDCQFIQEKCATFRFSKCKQTFSTMPSHGIRFGLGSDTYSDFSESDCSDCEILEGSHRDVREQWEQAALLRKMKKAGKAGLSEEAGPSNLHCDTNFEPGFERRTEQHDQTSFFFAARNPDGGKAGLTEEAGPSNLHCDNNFRPGFESRTEQHDQTSFFFTASNPDGEKETSSTFFGADGRIPDMTTYFGSVMEEDNQAKHTANSTFSSKEDFRGPSPLSPGIRVEHERFDTPPTHFTSPKEPIHQTSFKKVVEQPNKVQVQCETSLSPEENQNKNVAYQSYTKEVEEEEDASKLSPPQTSNGYGDTTHVFGTQSNGARCEHGISLDESREPIIDPIPSTSGQVQGTNGTAPAIDVMLNREILKETDEYKRAQEEEWESRQRQLQIQADEAQKQRKRRKLENMRKLEMERRQKERVEEVRETQKKDEENMNMKEKVRAEITKSLKLLELKSFNMAALLRGLGIQVGGGISPLPNEVHAAYKRAVLKFHPDRASRGGDIKQQVEAEEKFKLIARMKDKFKLIAP